MSTISTHVLDTARGRPASGLVLRLERLDAAGTAHAISERTTNEDGRVKDLVPAGVPFDVGTYRMRFDTGAYFAARGERCFYPDVVITFAIDAPDEHYHVPLLLAPYGYSTYRGS